MTVVNEAWGGAVTSRLAGTWELRGAGRVRARTTCPRVMNRGHGRTAVLSERMVFRRCKMKPGEQEKDSRGGGGDGNDDKDAGYEVQSCDDQSGPGQAMPESHQKNIHSN